MNVGRLLTFQIFLLGSVSGFFTIVQYGENFPVVERFRYLIGKASSNPIIEIPYDNDTNFNSIPSGSILLSFGNASYSQLLINPTELIEIGSEGFIVNSTNNNGALIIAANGNSNPDSVPNGRIFG